ncbi:MAG: insulinase family protein [Deltaproteobacteria bacterium]|nr:insulinase family protein [Deltaproteobacteria bacterium]
MRRALPFLCTLLAVLLLSSPGLVAKEKLQIPELDALGLSADLQANIARVFASRPGDTFFRLRNGMTVLLRENHSSPVVACRILVRTGSIDEGKYFFGGLSHYLEHVVAGGSTRSFTEDEAQNMVRAMGGASNAYTSYDRTVYFINTTADHYGEALKLLFSYVSECKLEPREVEREKAVIQQEFKLGETDADRQLWQLFMHTAYLKNPVRYPVIGYEDVFVQVERDDLLHYYKERYVPENMVVAVVGNIDTAETVKTILQLTSGLTRTFHPPTVYEKESPQNSPRWAERTFPPARLTTMIAGFHTVSLTHPDLYPLDVLAIILGRGRTSRLYTELRDKKKLVLSADAFSWTPSYASGIFGFSFSLERQKVDGTLEALWKEIERVQSELVDREELAKAKRQVVADAVFAKQSAAGMASSLAGSYVDTGDPYFDDAYVKQIRKVTREDVRQVAQTYLQKDRLTVAILSPPGKGQAAGSTSLEKKIEEPGRIQKFVLDNGLVLLVKRNPTVPIVNFQVFGLGGQLVEPKDLAGVSYATMKLLTKGTRHRSKRQIAETVENLGGSLAAGSGRNTYYVSLALLKDDFDTGLNLLADVLMEPTFPQEEIDKQRQDTLLQIRQLDEDWQQEVARLFRQHFYDGHPYARDIIGTEEAVNSMTRADIVKFYRRTVEPNNMVLAIFGDIELAQVLSRVNKVFAKWQAGSPVRPLQPQQFPRLERNEEFHKKTDKVSAAIYVGSNGLAVTDRERPALDVIDAVISGIGYPSGWLQDALRGGDRSLVYVVHGFPVYGIGGGHFGIISQTTMANYQKVVDIILANLKKIQEKPLTAEELKEVRNMCITMHEMGLETNGAQARSAALNEVLGLGYDWDSRYAELINKVTAEEVLELARKLFAHHMLVSTIPEHPVEAVIPPERRKRMHVR